MVEKVATRERLTNYNPTRIELLEMFAVEAKGIIPLTSSKLPEGLWAAAKKFPPLGVFVDDKKNMKNLGGNFTASFIESSFPYILNNKRWGIPDSDPRRSKIKGKMEMMLTPRGKKALEEAAEAANKVWGSTAISSQ